MHPPKAVSHERQLRSLPLSVRLPALRAPEPTTNAGRYLQQLDTGDARFTRSGEDVSEELLAGLRRIQITTAKESP
ncbi:TPA: hypothetical protein UOA91_002895 [Stenotrophomonas maltophilia]|nr:hypothetical protein [Stenotrophomonas maltophilia]